MNDNSYTAQSDRLAGADDTAQAAFIDSRWEAGRTNSRNVLDKLAPQYDAFHTINTGKTAPHANNLGLPILFSMIMTAVARQAGMLFGQNPIVGFEGYSHGEADIAKRNEVLVTAQLRECDSFRKAVDFLIQAHLTGTGICRPGWRYEESNRMFRIPDGMGGLRAQPQKVVDFDGPDWMVVDRLDFEGEPNKKRPDDMGWIIYRRYEDLDKLFEMDAAHIQLTGAPLFKPGSLEALKTRRVPDMREMTLRRMGLFPSAHEESAEPLKYRKPVEIKEMYGLVPSEFVKDGFRLRHVIIGNGHTILADSPSPYWNGKKPCISYCPQPDPYLFDGVGKGDLVEPLQAAAARLMNSKLDAMDRTVNPMWLGNMLKIGNRKVINSKSGLIIPTQGPPSDALVPVPIDLAGFNGAFAEMAELRQFAQMATGLSEDGTMGLQGGDRQTAREFLGRQEAANTRLGLEAQLASTWVEQLGDWFRDLNQQYLSLPKQINILGDMSQVDDETGLPMPPVQLTIEAQDLVHNWKSKAVGPLMLAGKASQRQDAMQLLQIIGSIPPAAQQANWNYALKKTVGLFEGWDPVKMFPPMPNGTPQINLAGQEQGDPTMGSAPGEPVMNGPGGGAGGNSLNESSQMEGADNVLGGGI